MLMTKKTSSFKTALSFKSRAITHLYIQIEQQKQILRCIHGILPVAMAKHVQHCVVNGKKLLIYTDTAAWASQLRFYNSTILKAIAPLTGVSVSMMQVKIMVEMSRSLPPSRKPIIPSAENIGFIHSHGLTVSDEQLKLALLKLSATLAKLSKHQEV